MCFLTDVNIQSDNGEEKDEKSEGKDGETRDSTGGSPLESDAEDDDDSELNLKMCPQKCP